jgi:hypothetical protein
MESIGQFLEHVLTVYSGRPTVADLIIVNCGLEALFLQCSRVEPDEMLKADFQSQLNVCKMNMAAIVPRIPLHVPYTMDFVLALVMTVRISSSPCCQHTYTSKNAQDTYKISLHIIYKIANRRYPGTV